MIASGILGTVYVPGIGQVPVVVKGTRHSWAGLILDIGVPDGWTPPTGGGEPLPAAA